MYTAGADGVCQSPPGSKETLESLGGNRFVRRRAGGRAYTYDIPAGIGAQQPFLVEQAEPDGSALRFDYTEVDGAVQLAVITDASGGVTEFDYDESGHVTAVTDPTGRTATFDYDADDNLVHVGAVGGVDTDMAYDSELNVSGFDHDGGKSRWDFAIEPATAQSNGSNVYAPPGEGMWQNYRITATSPEGHKREYYYDGFHRTGWYISPEDYVEYVDANTNNYKSARRTEYSYSFVAGSRGVLASRTSPEGVRTRFEHDANGNLQTRIDGNGHSQGFEYNALGRVTGWTDVDGEVTSFTYADNGVDMLEVSNALGRMSMTYNDTHDVLSHTDRGGHETTYAYDADRRMIGSTSPTGIVRTYVYDADDHLVEVTRAGVVTETRTYDAIGRVETHTGADGVTRRYAYDDLNRVTHITDPDGGISEFVWSTKRPGQLLERRDRNGQVTRFDYDKDQRLTVEVNAEGGQTRYDFDRNGKRLVPPGDEPVTYDLDELGRLTSVGVGGDAFTFEFDGARPASGLPVRMVRPDGTSTRHTFDALARVIGIAHFAPDATPLTSLAYTYDARDHRDSETVTSGPDGSAGLPERVTYNYDRRNALLSTTPPEHAYAYDADGNLTRGYTPRGEVFTATYDAENRMTRIVYTDGEGRERVIEYVYGADNLVGITRKFTDGELVSEARFVRDGFLVLQARDGDNTIRQTYVWADGSDGGIGRLLALRQASGQYAYLYDGRGNVIGLVDGAGQWVARYTYDAFGVLTQAAGELDQPYRFSTKAYEPETGLSDFGYRFYDAGLGRWMTRDPMVENGGLNLYAYAGGDPINRVDPTGELWTTVLGAAIGGLIDFGLQMAENGGAIRCVEWGRVGLAAVMGATPAFLFRPFTAAKQVVSHWDTAGVAAAKTLRPGSWVMTGAKSPRNDAMTGTGLPFKNSRGVMTRYGYKDGFETTVKRSDLRWPPGWEKPKGLLGQRIYMP